MDEKQFKKILKIIKNDDAEAFEEFIEEENVDPEEIETEDGGIVYLLADHGAYNILYFILNNYEPDVNNEDGFCSALNVTEDDNIRSLLFEHGANNSMEDYEDLRFAVETINWEVLSFDQAFRELLVDAVVKKYGGENIDSDVLEEYKEALCFNIEDGEVIVEDKEYYDFSGIDLYEIVKEFETELSYDLTFEGTRWKLETNGVYFVN